MDIYKKIFAILIHCIYFSFCFGGKCETDIPTVHYDEIGCKPIYAESTDCKPLRYNCTEVINDLNNGLCVYAGKSYKEGESVDGKSLRNCMLGCSCTKDRSTKRPAFACAVADCFPVPLRKGCHHKSEFGQCCPKEVVCPPFTEDQKCVENGKTYYEGESFVPTSDKCQKCICQKGFTGKIESPFCERQSCSIGLFNSEKIADFCAPVYRKEDLCCPHKWKCEKQGFYQTLDVGEKYDGHLGKDQCRFGERIMKIGTKFEIQTPVSYERNAKCECQIPPLVTCYS